MLMVVDQAKDDEKPGNVTHMVHDMLQTQSMTDTMGGGDVVTETDNKMYTSYVTENVCCVGLYKQAHTQTSICECGRMCVKDNLTRRSELNNAMHKIQHHTHSKQVSRTDVDKVCCVDKGKPLLCQTVCCRVAKDINEDTERQVERKNEYEHVNQHTMYRGVGGGGEVENDENVGKERTDVFPSATVCCRDQTNTWYLF